MNDITRFADKNGSYENIIVRHFKGNFYRIICLARNTETEENMVVYQSITENGVLDRIWVRNEDMFCSEVDHEKYPDVKQKYRFEPTKTSMKTTFLCGSAMLKEYLKSWYPDDFD